MSLPDNCPVRRLTDILRAKIDAARKRDLANINPALRERWEPMFRAAEPYVASANAGKVLPLPRDDGWYSVAGGVVTFVPFRQPPDVEPCNVVPGPAGWGRKARKRFAGFSPWGKRDPIDALTELKGSGI